jgi:hypothetical protein
MKPGFVEKRCIVMLPSSWRSLRALLDSGHNAVTICGAACADTADAHQTMRKAVSTTSWMMARHRNA